MTHTQTTNGHEHAFETLPDGRRVCFECDVPAMHKSTNAIAELPSGWLNQHTGRYYRSAAHAYAAVLRADRKVRVGAITTIVWIPRTAAGTAAVRALGGSR